MKLSKKARRNLCTAIILTDKIVKVLALVACVLFLAWIAWSWFEVQMHNWTMLDPEPYKYSSINFFQLMCERFSK